MQAEAEVLEEVAVLDKGRILSLVGKLEKGGIRRVFQLAILSFLSELIPQ